MMKRYPKERISWMISIAFAFFFIAAFASAQDLTSERLNRLEYGKVIYIRGLSVDSKEIAPGSDAKIEMELENIGESRVRDIVVRLNLPAQFSPAIGDVVEKKIREMNGGERRNLSFRVSALASAGSGIYSFPMKIIYLNSIGGYIEENNTISLIVGDTPELFVRVAESEIKKNHPSGKLSLTVVNRGLIDVKFVTAELKENGQFVVTSSEKDYLGDIESDDFEDADFEIRVFGNPDSIVLPLSLSYRDANNREYSQDIDVELNIIENGDKGSNKWYFIVAGIAAAGLIAYWVIKKRKE